MGLINSDAVLEIKYPFPPREVTIEEGIKNKINDLFNDGS
jgi:hypothetical protein